MTRTAPDMPTPRDQVAAALAAADDQPYPGGTPDWDELADAVLQLFPVDALQALQRVRDLHCNLGSGYCEGCFDIRRGSHMGPVPWPCPTLRALEGED